MNTYRANGKLIITAEYLVMKGALALAVPVRFGQQMAVEPLENLQGRVEWTAFVNDTRWFSAKINVQKWTCESTNDEEAAIRLLNWLRTAAEMNPNRLNPDAGYRVTTHADFSPSWGLGSSSSLVAMISEWTGVDPFDLLFRTASGSGCDVAASMSDGPILYRMIQAEPKVEPVDYFPPFHGQIWFVYLGAKQFTHVEIRSFHNDVFVNSSQIELMDVLTRNMLHCNDMGQCLRTMKEHDQLVGSLLKRKPLQEERFAGFNGGIKQLGAWGGDFAMAVSEMDAVEVKKYFREQGLQVVFSFSEIVKTRK